LHWRLFLSLTLASVTAPVAAQIARPHPPSSTIGVAAPRLKVGLDANPKTASTYRQDAWTESIRLMQTTGATQFHYSEQWSVLETQPGVFNTSQLEFIVEQIRQARTPIAFTLKVVDAGRRTMPDAYKNLAWDSPQMIERLTRVVERVAPLLGSRPASYAIGNEIDMYLGTRPDEVAAYARMLGLVKKRVRDIHPEASFATIFQFGAAPQLRARYGPIVATLDHVAFTYYPLAADLTVRPPGSVTTDLPIMLAAAQPLPIALQEFGYPTSARLGSSPDQQSAFVRSVFDAVRAAGPGRVLGATYLFQADLPEWLVNDLVGAYGLDSENFRAFLTTLGLRDERDRPKQAWDEFVRQIDALRPKPP
jgi:hypothetical protein